MPPAKYDGRHQIQKVGLIQMKNMTMVSMAAGALAVVGIGLAAPALAEISPVDQIAASSGYALTVPGADDFGVLGDRGPRTGVSGPGFGNGADRPFYAPSALGR